MFPVRTRHSSPGCGSIRHHQSLPHLHHLLFLTSHQTFTPLLSSFSSERRLSSSANQTSGCLCCESAPTPPRSTSFTHYLMRTRSSTSARFICTSDSSWRVGRGGGGRRPALYFSGFKRGRNPASSARLPPLTRQHPIKGSAAVAADAFVRAPEELLRWLGKKQKNPQENPESKNPAPASSRSS